MNYTAQDVVYHLLASTAGGAQDGEHSAVRQAVVHGAREVFQARQWLWHTRTGYFTIQGVTLSAVGISSGSNAFQIGDPEISKAVVGRFVYADGLFPQETRIVSVQRISPEAGLVTLDKAAIATSGGTTAVSMQTYYDLPLGVKEIDTLMTQTVGTLHCYVPPNEWLRLQINTIGAGEPYYYTVMRSDSNPDRYQIRFVGKPTDGTTAHYTYRYIPTDIKYMGYERVCRDGTVTAMTVSGVPTVTGLGTSFSADFVGRMIRFGTTTAEANPVGSLSPYQYERTIVAWVDGSTLKVDSSIETQSNVKYAVTDILDASPQMYTAILSGAEMWYARLTNKNANEALVMFTRDLRLAMEMDSPTPQSNRMRNAYPTARSHGWYSPIQSDRL